CHVRGSRAPQPRAGRVSLPRRDETRLSSRPDQGVEEMSVGESQVFLPGEVIYGNEPVVTNRGRRSEKLVVKNTGDRPVQVGSHFHFFEVNKALEFDRQEAFGMHLDIQAGTCVRFEPGDEKEVSLVEFGGREKVWGLHDLTRGEMRSRAGRGGAAKSARKHGYRQEGG